jgi:hypothetical protein
MHYNWQPLSLKRVSLWPMLRNAGLRPLAAFEFEERGSSDIKGIGMMTTHILLRARA